jgi:magnesium chelatase family protein
VPVARTHSIALVGVEGHPVEIETDIENGLPGLLLVGLPDTALREARDRIRAAIINSGEQWPQRRITVGLSPASLPKRGSGFDLSNSRLERFYAFGGHRGAGQPGWASA